MTGEHRVLIGWGRRRRSWWVAIVLPALLLRSLIPIGFMPVFGPGLSVQLMLCQSYAPIPSMAVPAPMEMSSGTSMDMPMAGPAQQEPAASSHAGGNHSPKHQDHNGCPYGASPALAVPPLLAIVAPVIQPSPQTLRQTSQIAHNRIAARAQSPRGPPFPV